jgi:hypothetical protein
MRAAAALVDGAAGPTVNDGKTSVQPESIAPCKASFIIIGAMKGGTTSLYHYLVQHPCIASARNKELHYFDLRFHTHDLYWYWRRFPTKWEQKRESAASAARS